MTVMPIGWIAPAPSPCRARPAMSAGIDQASPHSTDAPTNTVIPKMSTGLRPSRSASLPYTGTVTACASR